MANQEETIDTTQTIIQYEEKKPKTAEKSAEEDIEELVRLMTRELAYYAELSAKQAEPKPFIIHKLHPRVKSADPASYRPTVVSIGPYHHGAEWFMNAEEKLKCLESVMNLNGESTMDKILAALAKEEQMARNIYSEDIEMDENAFLKMLALDSCYIMSQIFASEHTVPDHDVPNLKSAEKISRKKNGSEKTDILTPLLADEIIHDGSNSMEPVPFYQPWFSPYVARDLLLLENQIPFYLIEKIYEIREGEFSASALREKAVLFVKKIIQPYLKNFEQGDVYNIKPKEFHHLLHLCHMYFKPLQNHKEFDYEKVEGASDFMRHLTRWRRATQYEEIGIKIKKKKYDERAPHSLLDVTFQNDEIQFPVLSIDRSTVPLFRNMVVLEQMNPRYGNNFTSYIIFLSQIMCMPSDVTFLVRKGIINHSLSSDEDVSNQFASLTRSVVFDFSGKYYLKTMSWEVDERYHACQGKRQVRVFSKRFRNPWWAVLFWAGAIFVLCTIARLYFIIMSRFSTS